MSVIRLPQPYANNRVAMQNMEALMTLGEEAVYMQMYHVIPANQEETDALETQPRCSNCYDEDYKQQDQYNCLTCYGTTFEGGVKRIGRIWCIFGDQDGVEDFSNKGVWNKDSRSVQLEVTPVALEHDYIIRVQQWNDLHVPLLLGDRYVIDAVKETSVRTGSQYGQRHTWDKMGQQSIVSEIGPKHPILSYPLSLTDPMTRFDEPLSYGIAMWRPQ